MLHGEEELEEKAEQLRDSLGLQGCKIWQLFLLRASLPCFHVQCVGTGITSLPEPP